MYFPDSHFEYEVEFADGKGGHLGSKPTFTLSADFMTPLGDKTDGTGPFLTDR